MNDPARYGRKRTLRYAEKRFQYQRELPLVTPLSQRLELWRSGYRGATRTLYDLDNQAENYLPDLARLETFFINGAFARNVLNDKLLFSKLVGEVLNVPTLVALIERGTIFVSGGTATLQALAAEHSSLILKPSDGTRGYGIYRLEHGTLNGQSVTSEALDQLVRGLDNYLVTNTVVQAPYAQAIFPGSTNSMRIMTLIDPDTQEPFIASAVHRFGVAGSVPTDNWARGGVCPNIDLATGRLGPGVRHAKRTENHVEWLSHHPETGAAIEGVMIPNWQGVCQGLIEAVKALPFLTQVGWDVVVTSDGFSVLEGNNNPDLDVFQVHEGLLRNQRVRRFYEYHKVIAVK